MGDDGEGDALAGLEMASRYGPVMAAVFIHRVKPLEVEPVSPDPAVVVYFSNYAEVQRSRFYAWVGGWVELCACVCVRVRASESIKERTRTRACHPHKQPPRLTVCPSGLCCVTQAALEAFRRNLISGRGLRAVADDIRADPVYTEGLDQHEVSAKTLGLTAALEAIDGELE